ncbi:MAG: hypothetical protein A2W31_07580 [Planctomycetes bacterium RBG_16_64_10]|nr:MAG: hypothetical protein A2W31_07580 [Planctomycetes bacterium RBG_16_64_10]
MPKLESSPTDVRAKTELYLFLGWMWILIFIVLYVLRQKAKQADDLVRYRFFDEPEPPSPPRTIA